MEIVSIIRISDVSSGLAYNSELVNQFSGITSYLC